MCSSEYPSSVSIAHFSECWSVCPLVPPLPLSWGGTFLLPGKVCSDLSSLSILSNPLALGNHWSAFYLSRFFLLFLGFPRKGTMHSFVWLFSFSIMFLRFFQVVTLYSVWISEFYSFVRCITVYSSIDEHVYLSSLGLLKSCFCVQVFVWTWFFLLE